jgi:hypothetical protein
MIKVNLKNILGLAALSLTLLANTVPTWAGAVAISEVEISTSATHIFASGSMVGARYSADSEQSIGCEIIHFGLGHGLAVLCRARDSKDNLAECFSNDPRYIEAVQGMTDSSYIDFARPLSDKPGLQPHCMWLIIWDGSNQLE